MNLILLGAPGSGKGTLGRGLNEKYHIPPISTGEIFRDNIKRGTELGKKVKEIIDRGDLVSDEIVIEIVKDRLSQDDCKNGYMLDGFPRTVEQARALEEFASIDVVINLEVENEKVVERLLGRRLCPKCGYSTNTHWDYYSDICPKCGATVVKRDDDTEESIRERLNVYDEKTAPLIKYYKERNLLKGFDCDGKPADILNNVVKELDKLGNN